MKKFISVLLSGIIITLAIKNNAWAQSHDKGLAFTTIKDVPALISYVNENNEADKTAGSDSGTEKATKTDLKAAKANLKALKANFRAATDFKKEFKDVPDATWKEEENAIVASFIRDNVKTLVVYNKSGNYIHSLSFYNESNMPKDVKEIITRNYPNDDILMSAEIHEEGLIFHIVKLENKTGFKQVGVYNGETNLIDEIKKNR